MTVTKLIHVPDKKLTELSVLLYLKEKTVYNKISLTCNEIRKGMGLLGTDDDPSTLDPPGRVRDIVNKLVAKGKAVCCGWTMSNKGGRTKLFSIKQPATEKNKSKPKKGLKKVGKGKKTTSKKQTNKVDVVGLVLDVSGSMSHLYDKSFEVLNNRIQQVVEQASLHNRNAYFFITVFSEEIALLWRGIHHNAAKPIRRGQLEPSMMGGATALHDAVVTTIIEMEGERRYREDIKGLDAACLLFVITDGEENASLFYKNKMKKFIDSTNRLGKWSIGFLCPPRSVRTIQLEGIPIDNIQPWEATVEGLRNSVDRGTTLATERYFNQRSIGTNAVKNLFIDMSNVSGADLSGLTDVSEKFQPWKVEREEVIASFVNKKLESSAVRRKVGARSYKPGDAFYELSKKELVQYYKQILVLDKNTGRLVCGSDARRLIGLNCNQDARVDPHDLGKFKIFIQSTSNNRKLVRGTVLMYRKM